MVRDKKGKTEMAFEIDFKESTDGGGEAPNIPDDTYDARVSDVSDPFVSTDFNGNAIDKITVDFEILPTADQLEYGCDEGATRRMWISISSHAYEGRINKESNLHKFLTCIGYDLSKPTRLAAEDWIGKRCRVLIKNTEKGPRIAEILAPRAKKPVAAGRRHEEDDD